jgi:predicted transcriptional regulator
MAVATLDTTRLYIAGEAVRYAAGREQWHSAPVRQVAPQSNRGAEWKKTSSITIEEWERP